MRRRVFLMGAGAAATTPWLQSASLADTGRDLILMVKQMADPNSFDPAHSYELTSNEVNGNCYRKLVKLDPHEWSKVSPDLAESWNVSSDGTTFTFRIRGDAKFDTGQPVTAQDAEFSLHRVVQLEKPPAFIITQFGFNKDNVAKLIRATDDRTLVITLPSSQATSFVLYCLSANVGSVVNKAAVLANQSNGDLGNTWLKTNSAGAGPYKLTSWIASDRIILDANLHSSIAARTRRIIIRHVPDPSAQLLLLQNGDADIARDLTSDMLKTMADNKAFRLDSMGQLTSLYISMNGAVPELAKIQVQQAVKWAIDYDSIAKNITPNRWGVQQSMLPTGMLGSLKEQPFKKDTAKARKLLAEVGLEKGFAVTMDHDAVSPYGEIAQAVQADLAEIGIKIQLLPSEHRQVLAKERARQHQMALRIWGADYFDPNTNAQAFCANPDDSNESKLKTLAWRSHFSDAELTRETESATKELDTAKRASIYEKMQRQIWERSPFALMLQKQEVVAVRRNVTGLQLGPMNDFTSYAELRKE